MKGSDKWGGIAHWKTAVSLVFVAAFLVMSAHAQQSDSSIGQSLVLNVYLDNAGKALITGYAEDVSGLAFLTDSQFRFENDSHQLYALTDRLTAKAGDLWTLSFDANGSFDDYRVTFYLPSETSLGEINASQGLGYLLSASNESLVADVQGYEVSNPLITIHVSPAPCGQRQQPAASSAGLSERGCGIDHASHCCSSPDGGFWPCRLLAEKEARLNGKPNCMQRTRNVADATSPLPEKHDSAGPVDLPSVAANASSSVALDPEGTIHSRR